MKGTGRGHFEGSNYIQKGQRVPDVQDEIGSFLENEWEASEELTPDPYAEEEHTQIHNGRFSHAAVNAQRHTQQQSRNQEKS